MRQLRAAILRVCSLMRGSARDRELREELEAHIQLHVDDGIRAGLSPEEARRQALVALGGLEQTRERCRDRRGLPSIEGLLQDLRFAVRVWRRTPGVAAAAVLTLAIGVSAVTTIFSFASPFLLRPLPFEDPDRLVALWEHDRASDYSRIRVSLPNAQDWERASVGIAALALFNYTEGNLTGAGEPIRAFAGRVSADAFGVLGVRPLLGRTFFEGEDAPGAEPVAVISYGLWQRQYAGSADVLGRTIQLDDRVYTIVGVMPAEFAFPLNITQIWVPYVLDPAEYPRSRRVFQVVARLDRGVSYAQVQRELDVIARRLERYPENQGNGVYVQPLRAALNFGHHILQPMSLVLAAGAALVLLIACANVSNLLLSRMVVRSRELSLRTALGAARSRLIRQMLSETLLLALAGGLAGLFLSAWGLHGLRAALPEDLYRVGDIALDWSAFLFAAGASVLSAILVGLLPAVRASRSDIQASLRASGPTASEGPSGRRVRDALVVLQVGLALALLVGASLLLRTLASLRATDPGFDAQGVQTMKVVVPVGRLDDGELVAFHEALVEELRQRPGTAAACTVNVLPLNHETPTIELDVPGAPAGRRPVAVVVTVSPGYFDTFGIPLHGRDFGSRDRPGGQPVVIVSITLAERVWPGLDPIGRSLRVVSRSGRASELAVIGVAGDVRHQSLDGAPMPEIYRPAYQQPPEYFRMAVRSQLPQRAVVSSMREALSRMDPTLAVSEIRPLQAVVDESVLPQRKLFESLVVLSGAALLMALVGIAGVMSYFVAVRRRELGIRAVLGAAPSQLFRVVIGRAAALAGLGSVLGVGLGAVLARSLSGFLVGVPPLDPASFTIIPLLLMAAACAACGAPAWRALRVDPISVIRTE